MEDLSAHKWTCACCGDEHVGLGAAYTYIHPDNWVSATQEEKDSGKISTDLCFFTNNDELVERYVYAILPFPIKGYSQEFHFGVWMSVSEKSFIIYATGFENDQYEVDNCFGYLMHYIPEFGDTWALNTTIEFQRYNQRPLVFFHEYDHPLVHAQKEGLELDYIKRLISSGHRN
jgi:hypothetical protein